MLHKESKSDRNKRFARIWSLSRSDAGKTQEFMANGLGVSKKTIQNWEKGASAPDLYEGSEWFRVLGTNPMPYYLAFLYPWLFDGIKHEDDDQEIEQALLFLVKNMTQVEKRQLKLPTRIKNVIHCKNPRCITSVEQELPQVFTLTDPATRTYRCLYCEAKAENA